MKKQEPNVGEPVKMSASMTVVPEDKPPVDLKRLQKITQNNPKRMREIIELYLSEAGQCHTLLKTAIETKSAEKVNQLAHKWAGASLTSGMSAVVPALRELERMGREGELVNAESHYEEVTIEFERMKGFLNTELNLKS